MKTYRIEYHLKHQVRLVNADNISLENGVIMLSKNGKLIEIHSIKNVSIVLVNDNLSNSDDKFSKVAAKFTDVCYTYYPDKLPAVKEIKELAKTHNIENYGLKECKEFADKIFTKIDIEYGINESQRFKMIHDRIKH